MRAATDRLVCSTRMVASCSTAMLPSLVVVSSARMITNRPCQTRANVVTAEESRKRQCYTHAQTLPEMASPPVSSEPAGATPAMRQYFEAKRQFRDAIVFFRMGDFYEMFYEDALTAARALELTLTSRSKDSTGGAIPMCGVPHHAADGYIARLVKKGFRVAVCEQMEDPKKAKGLVRREVVRVVSPGTLTDAGYLEAREPAFLMGIFPASPRRLLWRCAARRIDGGVHHHRVCRRRRTSGAGRRTDRAASARNRRPRRR